MNPRSRRTRVPALAAVALVLAGCAAPAERATRNPLEQPPVDTSRVRNALESAGWDYRRAVEADLDGDAADERLILASDVPTRPDGTPIWEDGHRWAVWAETRSGERTMLYSGFVPHGFVEVGLVVPDDRGRRRVLVQERSARQLRAFEVEYEGPGRARGASAAHWALDAWLQDLPEAP